MRAFPRGARSPLPPPTAAQALPDNAPPKPQRPKILQRLYDAIEHDEDILAIIHDPHARDP